MGQSMVYNSYNYGDYTERIRFLRTNGDQLLQRIQLLETSMNKRKQQNQQPHQNEITNLQSMAAELLQTLAEINTCQYFLLTNEYFNFNDYYFKQMCLKYFQDLVREFNFRLKAKRLNQIKRNLIDEINKVNDDDDDDDIDFLISR